MAYPNAGTGPKMQPIPVLDGGQKTGRMVPTPGSVPNGGTEGPVLGGPVAPKKTPYKNLKG